MASYYSSYNSQSAYSTPSSQSLPSSSYNISSTLPSSSHTISSTLSASTPTPTSVQNNGWITYDKNSPIGTNHIYIINKVNDANEYTIGTTLKPLDIKTRFDRKHGSSNLEYKIISNKDKLEEIILNILATFRQKDVYGDYTKRVIMNKGPLTHIIDWCIQNYESIDYTPPRTNSSIRSSVRASQQRVNLSSYMITELCITLIDYFNAPFTIPMEIDNGDESGSSSFAHDFTQPDLNKIISVCG